MGGPRRIPGADERHARAAPVDLRDPTEAEIARQISLAWRELRRGATAARVRDHLFGVDGDGLEPSQMDALDVLLTRRSWRMSELAEALRVDPSTATRTVQRLVNDGLAVRRTPDDDGRVVLVAPSAEGRRRHRLVARRRVALLSQLLAAYTADERAELAELLTRFIDELGLLVSDLAAQCDAADGERGAARQPARRARADATSAHH